MIKAERLYLDPLLARHAEELWPLFDDPSLWEFFPHLRPDSLDALRARFHRWEQGSPSPNEQWRNWVIRLNGDDSPIGTAQATICGREALLGYTIFKRAQRRGYGAEAVGCLIDYLRTCCGVNSVLAKIDARNTASIALVRSLGLSLRAPRDDDEAGEVVYCRDF